MKSIYILVLGIIIMLSSLIWLPIDKTITVIQLLIGFIVAIYASFKVK